MKNADMPAMPAPMIDTSCQRNDGLDESGRYLICNGLTKRETIAMHLTGHIIQALYRGASEGEWDHPDFEEVAEQAIRQTDALLNSLD